MKRHITCALLYSYIYKDSNDALVEKTRTDYSLFTRGVDGDGSVSI
jgi:hypothetical protein